MKKITPRSRKLGIAAAVLLASGLIVPMHHLVNPVGRAILILALVGAVAFVANCAGKRARVRP